MKSPLLLLVAFFLINHFSDAEDFSNVVNKKIERQIDLSSQIVTINLKIIFENVGKSILDNYYLRLDENHLQHLSFVKAIVIPEKYKLEVTSSGNYLIINLNEQFKVKPNEQSKQLEIELKFTHLLDLFPEEILQSERQFVVYNGNHYVTSPYMTRSQTTKVKLPSSGSIESFSKLKPSSQTDRTITYGPYENIVSADSSTSPMKIHYENNSPFLTVSNIERKIEVSHWAGIVSIEEKIDIKHTGAKLKGPFSRYEYQREATNGISSVKSFKTKLPPTAQDIYYRDEIGNISTSNVRNGLQNTIIEIRPRFPLFGGWKTFYILGYYLPSNEFLFSEGNKFLLKLPFVNHIYDNSVIEHATVKIILPEGSTNIKLNLPYSLNRNADEKHYTFLDTIGRPVIVLSKENLVESHIQNIEIKYTYNRLYMLQEPALIITALFLLCLLVIIYVRLDFSLNKNPIKESAYKVTSLVERIFKLHDKRATIYSAYDQAAIKFKTNKDGNVYQSTLKKLNADHKQETQAINDLLLKLKQEGSSSDVLEKVNELQRLDRTLKEQLQQQSTLVEKLVSNKINKQLYADTDNNITKKKEEISEKMTTILNSL